MSAAVVIRKQEKLISFFNLQGAIDPEHAIFISNFGIRRSFVFERMVYRRVFIECGPGKFYIDNAMVPVFRENRRARAILACVVVLIICFLYYLVKGM